MSTGDHREASGIKPSRRPRWTLQAWTVLFALAVCAPVDGQRPVSGPRSPSTARMAERLEALAAARESTLFNPYANAARLEVLLGMPPATSPSEQVIYQASVAGEMLRAGRTREATVEFERLLQLFEAGGGDVPSDLPDGFQQGMRRSLGIAYMRLAQRDNCLPPNPAARCAIPIDPAGMHPHRDSARKAVALYEQMAQDDPTDLTVRWVLNLAYMWLGEHPDGVPDSPGGVRLARRVRGVRGRRADARPRYRRLGGRQRDGGF